MLAGKTVLIIEDGNEYLENLRRFVIGPRYMQAHSGSEALETLAREVVDLVYLDMRFDRIERQKLLGDHAAATRDNNGDPTRAWRYLEDNQGLFVLDALGRAGYGAIPVILAYDFARESKRVERLQSVHPSMAWVPDAVTPEEIKQLMRELLERSS